MCKCQFTNCPNMCDHFSWSCHLNKCVKHDLDINNSNDILLIIFYIFYKYLRIYFRNWWRRIVNTVIYFIRKF